MEEYLRDFDIIRPKKAGSFSDIKVSVLDIETGIIYKSLRQAEKKMQVPGSKIRKYIKTGRFRKMEE